MNKNKHISLTLILIMLAVAPFFSPIQAGLQFTSLSLNTILHFGSGFINNFKDFGGRDTRGTFTNNQKGLSILGVSFQSVGQTMDDLSQGNMSLAMAINDDDSEAKVDKEPLVYPNPFRQEQGAQLGYSLNKNMDLEIHIYNMLAQRITQKIFYKGVNGGHQGYNKVDFNLGTWDGYVLSAGVYFYVLMNNGKVLAKGKMAVIP